MRKFKFRAYDKRNKKMFFVREMSFSDRNSWAQGSWFDEFSKDFELMQYTGFYDKHGKEIYEGDIIYSSKINILKNNYELKINFESTIVFEDGRFKLMDFDELITEFLNDAEIVGNIYE